MQRFSKFWLCLSPVWYRLAVLKKEASGVSVKVYRSRTRTRIRSGHFHSQQTTGTVLCAVCTSTMYYRYKMYAHQFFETPYFHTSLRFYSVLCVIIRESQCGNPRAPLLLFPARLPKHAPPTVCGSRPRDLTTEDPLSAIRRIRRVLVPFVSANQRIWTCYM